MITGAFTGNKNRFTHAVLLSGVCCALLTGAFLFFTDPVNAAHKLSDSRCIDCHAVGGARDASVLNTRLIKKDPRIIEILSNTQYPWQPGQPLPCVYCHDTDSSRINMMGVKNHFSGLSLSKHPVNYLTSSSGSNEATLKCVDCHVNAWYVGLGPNPGTTLSPNIHAVNADAFGWTHATGGFVLADTFPSTVSTVYPDNASGNTFCTQRCHNPGFTGYNSGQVLHAYATSIVSIEYGSSMAATIAGCLDEGSMTGCHAVHSSPNNTGLITMVKDNGDPVQRGDCGICHIFDDPPSNQASSDFFANGHGRFNTTNGINCSSCHDENQPHFQWDGISTGNRLNFVEDMNLSGLSVPPRSVLSNCVSSNCHAGKGAHSTGTVNVGCLDCHDPHGYGVDVNIAMVRRAPPVASPVSSIYFETTGAYYDSATYSQDGVYSNAVCDNQECHGAPGGPGPVSNLMNPALSGSKHTGGTGIMDNCGNCHIHDDSGGSFRSSDSCTSCHGQPPRVNSGGGPEGYAVSGSRSYAAVSYFKAEDSTPHRIHALHGPSGYEYECATCHFRMTDSAYHDTLTGNPQSFRNVIFDPNVNSNTLAEGPDMYSPSYSISQGSVCLNLYCHSDGQGLERFNTAVNSNQAWDDSTGTILTCEGCHGGVRDDSTIIPQPAYFGAPDYPTGNGGSGDSTYNPGSGVLASDTKANSHLDTLKHGRYSCSVCHNVTTTDSDPSDGWVITNRTDHVDGVIDVALDGTTASGAYDTITKSCQVTCHSDGFASRETPAIPAYSAAQWGGTVVCGDCHPIGVSLVTGSHAVHIDSVTFPNGPGIVCTVCHTSDTDPWHADGKVDFADAQVRSLTTVCDNCHGGSADGLLARANWNAPVYSEYSSGVTCESCHDDGQSAVSNPGVYGTVIAPSLAADFVDRGHGNLLGLPWGGRAPGLECVDCHDWNKAHIDGTVGSINSKFRVLDSIDGVALAGTPTEPVDKLAWCKACHDGSPAIEADTHNNQWVTPSHPTQGYREDKFQLNCTNCHNPHGTAQNIYMIKDTVTNSASAPTTLHDVVFLGRTGVNSFDDFSSVADTLEDQAGTKDICATCHYDPTTTTTYNRGGEFYPAQHGERRETDCTECHVHKERGFVATCDQCHQYPPDSQQHTLHLTRYGTNSCDNCHINNDHKNVPQTVENSTQYAALGSAVISSYVDVDISFKDFDGSTAASYAKSITPFSGSCSSLYCHGDWMGGNLGNSASWSDTATGACGTCHDILDNKGRDEEGLGESHIKHVGSFGGEYGFDCSVCHAGFGSGVSYAPAYTTHVNEEADVAIASSFGASALYSYGARGGTQAIADTPGTCVNVACHGAVLDPQARGTDVTPDWNDESTAVCGTCHLINDPVQGVIGEGSHVKHVGTGAGEYGFDCVNCHSRTDNQFDRNPEVNDVSLHADLTADVIFTARNVSGLFNTVADTCADLYCHGNWATPGGNNDTATWGSPSSAACGSCHGTDANATPNTFSHQAHLNTVPGGPGATCDTCHGPGAVSADHAIGSTLLHSNGQPDLYASVVPSGSGSTVSCSPTWVTGCHNGRTSPPWNGSASCTDCHAAGGGQPGDPLSALHVIAPAYSAVVQAHDQNLQAGTSPVNGCEVCHSGAPSDLHYDGIVNAKAPTINFSGDLSFTAGTTPTCAPGGTLSACHSDGGNWGRQWSDNAESLSETLGSPRCDVCHGQLNDWRTGTVDHDRGRINDGTHSDCKVCHVFPDAPYDWVTHHESGYIQYNSHASLAYSPTEGSCSSVCHDRTGYVIGTSPSFAESGLVGDGVSCTYCHGNDATGRIWPDNIDNNPSQISTIDDDVGAHDNHILAIGQYRGYGSTPVNYTGAEQVLICSFCHPNPGQTGHATDNPPLDRVDVHGAGEFLRFTVGAATYATDTSSLAYSYGGYSCSNLVCHNQNDTPTGANDWINPPDWTAGLDAKCATTKCHDTVTYTNSHNVHSNTIDGAIRGKFYPCTQCHVDNAADLAHQDGQVDMAFDNVFAGHLEADPGIGGGDGYYDKDNTGSVTAGDTGFAYRDGNYDRSCYNVYCHGDDWPAAKKGLDTTPVWNDWTTGSCGTCHGSVGSAWFSDPFVWSAEGPFTDLMDTGAHFPHFAQFIPGTGGTPLEQIETYGPNLNPHPSGGSCQTCHTRMRSNGGGCDSIFCHPARNRASNIDLGDEHINGFVNFQTADSFGSTTNCDTCHGGPVGAAIAKANWPSTGKRVTCESCHGDYTLARSRTNGTWAPETAGTAFDITGHGNVSGTGANCVDCHDENSDHITHALNDTNRLDTVSGSDYGTSPNTFCASACHGSAMTVHYDNTNTTGGTSDDGDNCYICHDPHGQSGFDAMIVLSIGGSASRTIASFPDRTQRTSYYVANPGGANDYGICQVCHDPSEVLHFNRAMEEGGSHQPSGGVCTVCHQHDSTTAFEPSGTACNDCHGNPPASGAHSLPAGTLLHARVTTNDLTEDRSDCAWCHTGADSYTFSPGTDQANSLNHSDDAGRIAALNFSVGYNSANGTCTSACHASSGSDGFWADVGGLDCDACHYYALSPTSSANTAGSTYRPISEMSHDSHFATVNGRQFACVDCHTDNAADTSPLTHMISTSPADSTWLVGRAVPIQDEATLTDTVWLTVSSDFNDTTDTCTNICHDPSVSGTYSAVWGQTNASCAFCHSDTDPLTGSHGAHLAATTVYGLSIGCADCHPDNALNYGHMTGAVALSLSNLVYSGSLATPYGTPFGTCDTDSCHNDGAGLAVTTSAWGTTIADPNCTICHGYPNTAGNEGARHSVHFSDTVYVANGCDECHASETAITHIDAAVDTAGSLSSFNDTTGGCVNTCHEVTEAVAGDWADTADLSCVNCHSGTYVGGGGYLPVSGLHNITPTVSGVTHAEALSTAAGCGVCHTGMVPMSSDPASHIDGSWEVDGATQTETRALFTDYTDGSPGTCSGGSGVVGGSGCHDGPGDAGSWARRWDTSAASSTGAECANCHGDFASGWVTGTIDHDRPSMADTSNHDNCAYCHVYDDVAYGTLGWDPVAASRHGDDLLTMNSEPTVDYNQTTFSCDGGVCHANDAPAHALTDSGWVIDPVDGPGATCTMCHGTAGVRYFPDGSSYPDRPGKHERHVTAIANVNSLSTTNDETCAWCHPGGGHSGDQLSAPADLHDGAATEFLNILGNNDSGTVSASAQQSGADTVGCSGVDCHYETDLPDSGWYTGPNASCTTCHTYPGTYNAGDLPNAHDIHVDEVGDLGYDLNCSVCHPIPGQPGHLNGIVEVTFPALADTDGDEAVAGSGGAVKFGFGTSVNYYTCENIYCHGDFDDGGIGGGNASNAPNWGVPSTGGCGTCHGDSGQATDSLKAAPVTGNSGTIHINHVSMAVSPAVNCTVCHFISWGGATNGSYGNLQEHADGTLQAIDLNNRFGNDPSSVIVDYENATGSVGGSSGSYTCANIVCHNGVTTPVWSDAAIGGFTCGDCHQDTGASSPLPSWSASVEGSHTAHANTDADYTDCDNCHGVVAGVYTAVGGTNHQNLIVDLLSLPGVGATYTDTDPAGVNWVAGDGIDDGTCSSVTCHGSGTPVWGGTVACGECHTDGGLPPTTGAHTPHFSAISGSNTDYTECVACHGDYTDTHADGAVDVAGAGVAYDSTANTCNTSVCHSPSGGSLATASTWSGVATLDCYECHYYEAVPVSGSNQGSANSLSPTHNGHFDAAGRSFVCVDCHGTVTDLGHISSVAGSDGVVLVDRANAVQDEATIAVTSWIAGGDWTDGSDTCANICHDPSDEGVFSATWGTTSASCTFCHYDGTVTDPSSGSHSEHLGAEVLYGRTIGCDDCHPSNGTVYDHMTGAVVLSISNLSYSGNTAAPYGTPFGTCGTDTCHNDGTGTPVATSAWGTTIGDPNCGICHGYPNTVSETGNEGARHSVHFSNAAYVANGCDDCHTAETSVTHIDQSVDIAGSISVMDTTSGTCTNTCHLVVDNTGDWADTADLACVNCHSGTYIGGGYLPLSGLHNINPTVSGVTHAGALSLSVGCGVCHAGMVPMSSDPVSHIDGTWEADGPANTESRALFTDYTDGTPGTCSGSPGTVGAAGCHDGPGEVGSWARRWDSSAAATTGAECANCHGDFATGWVTGLVDHGRPSMNDTTNHATCSYCHVFDNAAYGALGWDPVAASRHGDDQLTMNSDPSVDYNQTTFSCEGGVCHANDAPAHALTDSGWTIEPVAGPVATCSTCHGTNGNNYYPDDGTQNGALYPNRAGRHSVHIFLIANRNGVSSTNDATCAWCHPTGAHTGDQASAPADLHDGSTTQFMDIIGNTDGGTASGSAQQSGGNVSCSGVDCHYETTFADTEWYGASSVNCDKCHIGDPPYNQGELPGAHDIHCDEVADGGYGLNSWGLCMACHETNMGDYSHQDGVVNVPFDDPFGVFPDAAPNAAVVSNGGPLTGRVKYGGGNSNDYYSCTGVYCHGDFDDGGIGGGNVSNSPNWWDTINGAQCGSCHGDTGGADQTHQAMPITGNTGTIHADHVDMNAAVTVDCSVCHYDTTGTNGTYGNNAVHADAALQLSLRHSAVGATPDTDYEGNASAVTSTYGSRTCSAVVCHNGVTTPVFSDASTISCGNCHQDTAGTSPLPSWSASVEGSHAAHANTDADYTDCDDCHGSVSSAYTAGGGSISHQNLIVDLSLPGVGATYSDTDPAGVNWVAGDGVDDGTCSSVTCHGSGTPVWGGTVACGECHTDGGLPPTTGAHTPHFSAISGSNTDYTECVACHGDYTDTHADGTVDVAGAGVAYDSTANTCNTSVCHSPSGGSLATTSTWSGAAALDCFECHYHEAAPASGNNQGNANSLSPTHNGHFDAVGRSFVCVDCHGTVTDLTHISSVAGSDGVVLMDRANAVQDEATIAVTSWIASGAFDDTTDTCTNICHDPSAAGTYSATWGQTNASCVFCHSDTDPLSGSHSEHIAATTVYGLSIGCADCHPDSALNYGHMTGAVALSLSNLAYSGSPAAPYGTPYGACDTDTCHTDGTGTPVTTSAWGTTIADPNCGICHNASPATGSHQTHLAAVYGPGSSCEDCHDATNSTSMAGQASHIDGTATFASSSTFGGTTACETCHGGSVPATMSKGYWASASGTWLAAGGYCESCHGDFSASVIGGAAAPVRAGAVFDSAGHGKVTDTVTWGGSNCSDCHDEYDTFHIDATPGDNRLDQINGNDYGNSPNVFCASSCHSTVVNSHYTNAHTTGGTSDDGDFCYLCHDPHGQSGHDAMISAVIGSPAKSVVGFTDKTLRSSYFVASPSAGNYGVCQVCHDSAEVAHFNRATEEDATHQPGQVCTDCHSHDATIAFEVSCITCHNYPETTGAHNKHGQSQSTGGVSITCDVCHGAGAAGGSHPGHAAGGSTVQAVNITLLGQSSYVASFGARPSWFNSTWYSSAFGANSISYTDTSDFTCTNVRCHGGESVVWNQVAGASTYNDVCTNCHNITASSFQLPGSGTLYQASPAAVNYVGPISGFSRGGHGDTAINDSQWFEDTAENESIPVACVRCHDESREHFPVASGNPYRMSDAALNNTLPGRDINQTRITNLCTQTDCHPKTPTVTSTGTYAFTQAPKHPNDHFTDWDSSTRDIFVTDGTAAINNQSAGSSTTDPHYDPVGVDNNGDPVVGVHIDRYVDHWEWWNPSSPATSTNTDDVPFLPLGDSLGKTSSGSYDNATNVLVTCITCHNPHGTDLFVVGETPGSGSTLGAIPANKMLRLRDQDSELCDACH